MYLSTQTTVTCQCNCTPAKTKQQYTCQCTALHPPTQNLYIHIYTKPKTIIHTHQHNTCQHTRNCTPANTKQLCTCYYRTVYLQTHNHLHLPTHNQVHLPTQQLYTCQHTAMYTCQHKAAVHLPKKGNHDFFSVLISLHVLTFSDHFFQLIFLLVCFWHLSVMLRLTKVKKQKQFPIM